MSFKATGWPDKHGRVFLIPCQKWRKLLHISVHCTLTTSYVLHRTRTTRPCLTGHPVLNGNTATNTRIFSKKNKINIIFHILPHFFNIKVGWKKDIAVNIWITRVCTIIIMVTHKVIVSEQSGFAPRVRSYDSWK